MAASTARPWSMMKNPLAPVAMRRLTPKKSPSVAPLTRRAVFAAGNLVHLDSRRSSSRGSRRP